MLASTIFSYFANGWNVARQAWANNQFAATNNADFQEFINFP